MRKGFTLVEIIVCVLVVAMAIMIGVGIWKSFSPGNKKSDVCLERSLKQFTVGQGGISGSFFLGCGAVGGGEKEYYFYYKTKKGDKFRPAAVPLNRTVIVEDGQNKVIFIKQFYSDSILVDNAIDEGIFFNIKEFEFHIPKDSILEEYNPNFSSSS